MTFLEDTTGILMQMLGLVELESQKLYDEQIVHRTEPFTMPQVEAINL
jgi:hypothetical protein